MDGATAPQSVRRDIALIVVSSDGTTSGRAPQIPRGHLPIGTRIEVQTIGDDAPVAFINAMIAGVGRSDCIVIADDAVLGEDWLAGLIAAMDACPTAASASAIGPAGSVLFVAGDAAGLPGRAEAVAQTLGPLHPAISSAVPGCVFLSRAALDVAGSLDVTLDLPSALVDWSQRTWARGFGHVVADTVLVQTTSPAVASSTSTSVLHDRYTYLGAWVSRESSDERSPLVTAVRRAHAVDSGISVLIDGLTLHPTPTGTQIGILATARALARAKGISEVTLLVRPSVPDYVERALADEPAIHVLRAEPGDVLPGPVADVLFRPYQMDDLGILRWLRPLGRRFVINQLDLIAYDNPAYHQDDSTWVAYRDTQRSALATADGVAFISEFSLNAVHRAGLLTPGQKPVAVVYNGVEHYESDPQAGGVRPTGLLDVPDGFVLVLGVPYLHKNRTFALDVLAELDALGWAGHVVFAGPRPPSGSTHDGESTWAADHPALAARVHDLGGVSEEAKLGLYQRAGLVLYPTTVEGFGLIPFESAAFGVPCLSTRRGGLDEVLPPGIDVIVEWDAAATARVAAEVLSGPGRREALVHALQVRSADFTWDRTAQLIIDLLRTVASRPPAGSATALSETGALVDIFQRPPPAAAPEPDISLTDVIERFRVVLRPRTRARAAALSASKAARALQTAASSHRGGDQR